jgi:hypothetical protein
MESALVANLANPSARNKKHYYEPLHAGADQCEEKDFNGRRLRVCFCWRNDRRRPDAGRVGEQIAADTEKWRMVVEFAGLKVE